MANQAREGRALCLSGGGYRAAIFHLGAMLRLHEREQLRGLDLFSAVSGGSIALAWLAAATWRGRDDGARTSTSGAGAAISAPRWSSRSAPWRRATCAASGAR